MSPGEPSAYGRSDMSKTAQPMGSALQRRYPDENPSRRRIAKTDQRFGRERFAVAGGTDYSKARARVEPLALDLKEWVRLLQLGRCPSPWPSTVRSNHDRRPGRTFL